MACLRSRESRRWSSFSQAKDIGSFIHGGVAHGRVVDNFSSAHRTKIFLMSSMSCRNKSKSSHSASYFIVRHIRYLLSGEVSAAPLPFYVRWTNESPK